MSTIVKSTPLTEDVGARTNNPKIASDRLDRTKRLKTDGSERLSSNSYHAASTKKDRLALFLIGVGSSKRTSWVLMTEEHKPVCEREIAVQAAIPPLATNVGI